MIESFLKYIEFEKRYSSHTIISYRNDLIQFSDFTKAKFESTIEEANYAIIRSWIIELAENNISPRSINRKIASLRSFYKFLRKFGHITQDPTLKIKAPKIKKRLPVFVEEESLHKLLDNFHYEENFQGIRDKLILELLYGTGIRLSELIELKDTDINNFDRTIKVLGKGNKERIIPMNKNLLYVIDTYRETKKKDMGRNTCEYLIVTDSGDKVYPMFIYRIVKKYLNQVTTVEKKSPHVLRHSFATHLLNKGADLNAIKDLLGHSSLAATQVYTHNSLDKLKAIFDQAHPKS